MISLSYVMQIVDLYTALRLKGVSLCKAVVRVNP